MGSVQANYRSNTIAASTRNFRIMSLLAAYKCRDTSGLISDSVLSLSKNIEQFLKLLEQQ
jgi:hypothetical protein